MQDFPSSPPSSVSARPASGAEPAAAVAQFLAAFEASFREGSLSRCVLSAPCQPGADLKRLLLRPVELRGERCLSLVFSHSTRDITRNLPLEQARECLQDNLAQCFRHGHLHTGQSEWSLRISKKGQASLKRSDLAPGSAAASPAAASHDREKRRWVDPQRPFLRALGVMDEQQRVVPAMARKWKQINKFVEIFDHALQSSPLAKREQEALHVVDFGSGKGYLTFAVHDHLRHALGHGGARVTGVELRSDLVRLCQKVAQTLSLDGLDFDQGDVRSYVAPAIDVVIALHACDTATDHAIHLGVRSGAAIILCSPCCHKQIRPQLLSPHPLRPILQHGVHLGQEAEMLTDGLRALLLEAAGYTTQIFEFVSLEHTNKNKMILAVKRERPRSSAEVLAQIGEIKSFYGIREHCLEELLRGLLPA